jgi:carboxymethylenebutenolidase
MTAPTVQTEVSFVAGDTVLPGVLTVPAGNPDRPRPALLMIYEIFGVNEEMRRVARELAAEGYVVLIPDLFARGPAKPLCVGRALRTINRGAGRELDDLEAARAWLAQRPEVDGERIGAIGFCMGGGFALLLAGTGRYRVSAPFYGRTGDLQQSCPMVASFGGLDAETRGYPERLEANLERLGVPHDVRTYPEAGHSFFTRTAGFMGWLGPRLPLHAEYHEPSARDAHRRIVAFFREHLDG